MQVIINALGGGHTHTPKHNIYTQTHIHTHTQTS